MRKMFGLALASFLVLLAASCAKDDSTSSESLEFGLKFSNIPVVGQSFTVTVQGPAITKTTLATSTAGKPIDMCAPKSQTEYNCLSPSVYADDVDFVATYESGIGSGSTSAKKAIRAQGLEYVLAIKDEHGHSGKFSNNASKSGGDATFATGKLTFDFDAIPGATYSVAFGDGTTATGQHFDKVITLATIDSITVTVVDGGGLKGTKSHTVVIECPETRPPVHMTGLSAALASDNGTLFTPAFDGDVIAYSLGLSYVLDTGILRGSGASKLYPLYNSLDDPDQRHSSLPYATWNSCAQQWTGDIVTDIPRPAANDGFYINLSSKGVSNDAKAANVAYFTAVPLGGARDPKQYSVKANIVPRGSLVDIDLGAYGNDDPNSLAYYGAEIAAAGLSMPPAGSGSTRSGSTQVDVTWLTAGRDRNPAPGNYGGKGTLDWTISWRLVTPGTCGSNSLQPNGYKAFFTGHLNKTTLTEHASGAKIEVEGDEKVALSQQTTTIQDPCVPAPSCNISSSGTAYQFMPYSVNLSLVGASTAQVTIGSAAATSASAGAISVPTTSTGTVHISAHVTNSVGSADCSADVPVSSDPGAICSISVSDTIVNQAVTATIHTQNTQYPNQNVVSSSLTSEGVTHTGPSASFTYTTTGSKTITASETLGNGQTISCQGTLSVGNVPADTCAIHVTANYTGLPTTVWVTAVNDQYHHDAQSASLSTSSASPATLSFQRPFSTKTVVYSTAGTYQITGTMTDGDGNVIPCTAASVTINDAPPPPPGTCSASSSPSQLTDNGSGANTTYRATITANGHTISRVQVKLDDGSPTTLTTSPYTLTSPTYHAPSNHTALFTVDFDSGTASAHSATCSTSVSVSAPVAPPPPSVSCTVTATAPGGSHNFCNDTYHVGSSSDTLVFHMTTTAANYSSLTGNLDGTATNAQGAATVTVSNLPTSGSMTKTGHITANGLAGASPSSVSADCPCAVQFARQQ